MASLNIFVIFAITAVGLMLVVEIGYRVGRTIHERSKDEKETPVFAVSAATLGLLAFMLALTFGLVADRFQTRRNLVRDEANAIGTAYLRADFLPEPDRAEAKRLLRLYTDERVHAVLAGDRKGIDQALRDAPRFQQQLWEMAVRHGSKDLNSDIGALYVASLNQVIDLHALRVTAALQTRIPSGVMLVLYALIFFGMISIGYQTGIAGSKRSLAILIMVVSFAMVLSLIVFIDRPFGGIRISQQPLINARAAMN